MGEGQKRQGDDGQGQRHLREEPHVHAVAAHEHHREDHHGGQHGGQHAEQGADAFHAAEHEARRPREQPGHGHDVHELPRHGVAGARPAHRLARKRPQAQPRAPEGKPRQHRGGHDGVGRPHGAHEERRAAGHQTGESPVHDGARHAHLGVNLGPQAEQHRAAERRGHADGGEGGRGRRTRNECEASRQGAEAGEPHGHGAQRPVAAQPSQARGDQAQQQKHPHIADAHGVVEGVARLQVEPGPGEHRRDVGAAQPRDQKPHAEEPPGEEPRRSRGAICGSGPVLQGRGLPGAARAHARSPLDGRLGHGLRRSAHRFPRSHALGPPLFPSRVRPLYQGKRRGERRGEPAITCDGGDFTRDKRRRRPHDGPSR